MNDENLTLKEIQLLVSNLQSQTCKIESDQATIIARDSVVNDVIRNIEDRTKSRIPITNRMVVSYTKNFINNLLNIASECYTDIKYECNNSYINFKLRYYIGGNYIDVSINDMLLIYNDEKYNMYELFVNTVQEKAILYNLKEKIQMFYKMNT